MNKSNSNFIIWRKIKRVKPITQSSFKESSRYFFLRRIIQNRFHASIYFALIPPVHVKALQILKTSHAWNRAADRSSYMGDHILLYSETPVENKFEFKT